MFIEHLDFIPIAELGDSRSLSQPVDCYFLPSLFNPCASANIPIRLYVELWLWSMQHSCLQAHLLFCMLRCVACGLLSKFVGRLSAGCFSSLCFPPPTVTAIFQSIPTCTNTAYSSVLLCQRRRHILLFYAFAFLFSLTIQEGASQLLDQVSRRTSRVQCLPITNI